MRKSILFLPLVAAASSLFLVLDKSVAAPPDTTPNPATSANAPAKAPGERKEEIVFADGGFVKRTVIETEHKARMEARDADWRAVVQKDMADGINAEVRRKEAELRNLALTLSKGESLTDVTNAFGTP